MTLNQGTFFYSGDPSYSVGDEVRFLMQDTDRTDPQVSDEEIAYMVTQHGNASTCAVALCNVLATRYAQRSVDSKEVGDLKITYADRASAFRALAVAIETSAASNVHPIPVATGITISGRELAAEDEDRVQGEFSIGMDDIPGNYPPPDQAAVNNR